VAKNKDPRISPANIERFVEPFRVTSGKRFRLRDYDPGDTRGLGAEMKEEAEELLERGVALLATYQDMLYAQDRWGLLLVIQAMDGAGKDGAIKHVMSGVNPQGVHVTSFKSPSAEELDHDYLWRCMKNAPERGRIGIFNRSYYEEVLVARVHPEILEHQKLPPSLVTKRIWDERYEDIQSYERYLARNGIVVRKIFLNVSKQEQKKRFLARLEEPEKNWKFSAADVRERGYWKEYQRAYEDAIAGTATKHSPWFVVPADTKWFSRLVVAAVVLDALDDLGLHYPKVSPAAKRDLAAARRKLLAER